MSGQYGAVRGCSSCPFRGDPCHEARQRVQDPEIETGRHYECEFYRAIEEARRRLSALHGRTSRIGG